MNITQIEESLRELVEIPFEYDVFIYRLLEIYGAPKATVTKLRQANSPDLIGSDEIIVKKKLVFRLAAKGKASAALDEMARDVRYLKAAPRFLMATDGIEFYAKDIKLEQSIDTTYENLNNSFDFFLPLAGIERYKGVAENPADIKATSGLAKLYDAILEVNPNWGETDRIHELNQLMTRLLFCFFAEGTSIFSKGQFTNSVMKWSKEDGSDTSIVIGEIFKALSLAEINRTGILEYAKAFPYVNGGLFKNIVVLPNFSKRSRRLLRECGELDWSSINPDIFGSMIQAIVEPQKRADLGLHYTNVSNIMKVLHPLFLLELEEEFEVGRDSQVKLQKLLLRLTKIRVFDPACGSGNFLIIAYKELRKLEIRVFKRLKEIGQSSLAMTSIQLSQFYGIEYADFAAETAKLSLWISEYQMNHLFKDEFGESPPDLPLRESGNISHDNALRVNWLKICPPAPDSETYIVGNPPYLGRSLQSVDQKEDMEIVFTGTGTKYKNLDYVACWLMKGTEYLKTTNAKCAFVATNSICQGEQVPILWPNILKNNIEIGFAHTSFKWKNNASANAGVICVVIGIRNRSSEKKIIFSDGLSRIVKNISPYLIEFDDSVIEKRLSPLSGTFRIDFGSMANDGGNLILSDQEADQLKTSFPKASKFLKKLVGSQEFIRGESRWCLWIKENEFEDALSIPIVRSRVEKTKKYRLDSERKNTNELAEKPYQFGEIRHEETDAIIVPRVFSEHRPYLTVGFVSGTDTVISDSAAAIFSPPHFLLAVMSTKLHFVWAANVGGRLKTDIRYSNSLVFNTFPFPEMSEQQKDELEQHTWSIIRAREANSGKTIAWLYNPETMPANLRKAHQELDESFERICIGRSFKNDTERLEYLFKQYAIQTRNGSTGAEPELGLKGKKK